MIHIQADIDIWELALVLGIGLVAALAVGVVVVKCLTLLDREWSASAMLMQLVPAPLDGASLLVLGLRLWVPLKFYRGRFAGQVVCDLRTFDLLY